MSKKIYIHMQLCPECSNPDYYGLCDKCILRLNTLKASTDIDREEQDRLSLTVAIEEGDCHDCEHDLVQYYEEGRCRL